MGSLKCWVKGERKILKEETEKRFGYVLEDLSIKSNRSVLTKCEKCGMIEQIAYKDIMARHRCQTVQDDKILCYKCEQWKSKELYIRDVKYTSGFKTVCRQCFPSIPSFTKNRKDTNEKKKNLFFDNMAGFMKYKHKNIKLECLNKNIPFDLTQEYLHYLWKKQKGCCYYTYLPMYRLPNIKINWNMPSIDRLVPQNGYVIDNVVWTCQAVNIFKNNFANNYFSLLFKEISWNKTEVEDYSI